MALSRKLGFWETVCKFGHDYYSATGNVVAIAKVLGDLDAQRFQDVLQLLFDRHPLLRASINEIAYELYFNYQVEFSKIPITMRDAVNTEDWQSVVEAELHQQFVINEYLWRANLLLSSQGQHYIILTFHHSIADGLSTAYLIGELLHYYAELRLTPTQTPDRLPILPCVEDMLPVKTDWQAFLQNKQLLKQQIKTTTDFHTFVPVKQRLTHNIYQELSVQSLERLRLIARQENSTINSALNAAMLLTARSMQDHDLNTSLHTPVNLRNYCEPKLGPEHVGCYISMVTTVHNEIDDHHDFWTLARSYQSQLHDNIPKIGFCPSDFYVGNFDIVEIMDLFDMPGSTKRKYFVGGYGVTNIGNLSLQRTYGDLYLDSFIFCTNREMGDFIIFLNVASLHGRMKLCFSYTEPLVAKEWAKQFVKNFMDRLNLLMNNNKHTVNTKREKCVDSLLT